MSFMIRMKKNEQGTYDLDCTSPETLPDLIEVSGHVDLIRINDEPVNDVVDLTVRSRDLMANASKRQQYFHQS